MKSGRGQTKRTFAVNLFVLFDCAGYKKGVQPDGSTPLEFAII